MSINSSKEKARGDLGHSKKFIKPEDYKQIEQFVSQGITDPNVISQKVPHSVRKIKTYINCIQKGIKNVFTIEEDILLAQKLKEGITSQSVLAKIIITKIDWMIRNRIKIFHRYFGEINNIDVNKLIQKLHQNDTADIDLNDQEDITPKGFITDIGDYENTDNIEANTNGEDENRQTDMNFVENPIQFDEFEENNMSWSELNPDSYQEIF